jgi:hypothetical protein
MVVIEAICERDYLSPVEVEKVHSFIATRKESLSTLACAEKEQCRMLHKYYKRAKKLAEASELKEMRGKDGISKAFSIAGADTFIKQFSKMYHEHTGTFKDYLLCGLLECTMVR